MFRVLFNTIYFFSLILLTYTVNGQTSGYAKSKDVEIYYHTFGQGEPILIINGGPGFNSDGFEGLAKMIASLGYQTILFDQRGTGKSNLNILDSNTITMELMAKDIEAIRNKLHIKNWIVLGHSFGGIMAYYYATKYPSSITAMIQSASGGIDLFLLENSQRNLYSQLTEEEIDSLHYWRQQFRSSNSEGDRFKFNQYLASAYVYDKKHIPVVCDRLMQGNLYLNGLVWSDLRSINYDCKSALKSFKKPILIIQGEQDVIPKELAYRADNVFENSKLVFLNKCGHYGWLDQKQSYLNEIHEFLLSIF